MTIELSRRQNDVLQGLLEGKTNKSIALTLNVSYSRVMTLVSEILMKTGLKNRTELLLHARTLDIDVKS